MITIEHQCEQIARAHKRAIPTTENPAWMNCHHDCGVLLSYIQQLQRENAAFVNARDVWANETARLRKRIEQLECTKP